MIHKLYTPPNITTFSKLDKFEPNTLSENSKLLIIGRSASGKTTLARRLNRTEDHDTFMTGSTTSILSIIPLPLKLRNSLDYIFLKKPANKAGYIRLYEYFGGVFSTFTQFTDYLDRYAKDYSWIVIKNNVNSPNIKDQVFWYKASL